VEQTATLTPSNRESPSSTPTQNVLTVADPLPGPSAPLSGRLILDAVLAGPDPNPSALFVHTEGPCDAFEVEIFSGSFVKAAVLGCPGSPGGWMRLPLPAGWSQAFAKGAYFARVRAWRGTTVSLPRLASFFLL
jgi:hypothetical protein